MPKIVIIARSKEQPGILIEIATEFAMILGRTANIPVDDEAAAGKDNIPRT